MSKFADFIFFIYIFVEICSITWLSLWKLNIVFFVTTRGSLCFIFFCQRSLSYCFYMIQVPFLGCPHFYSHSIFVFHVFWIYQPRQVIFSVRLAPWMRVFWGSNQNVHFLTIFGVTKTLLSQLQELITIGSETFFWNAIIIPFNADIESID